MGVVYRGRDPFIGRTVAIKTITTGLADNPDLLERFYREAQAAGSLQHPNIVTIFDMGEDNTIPYIAMELLEGEDLAHIVAKEEGGQNPLPASLKLNYIVQVCRALDYAHRKNVIHRDIKPGNIVVTTESGTVKVVDFGIARLTGTSSTKSGMLIGTIDYMSPEQIRGEKVDGRSDIWSVGVMMYEVLTYTKPFSGSNITAVMFAIVSQEPKSICEIRPELPPELDHIIKRIFRKEAGERYQTMEELLLDLEPIYRKMQQESVGQLVSQADTLFNSGNLEDAKEKLKQALVLDTSHTHARTLLEKISAKLRDSAALPKLNEHLAAAEDHLGKGNLDDARREADAALRIQSTFQPARALLEKIQIASSRAQEVQTSLREARQRLAEGSISGAEESLTKVLSLSPEHPEAQSLQRQLTEEKDRRGKRRVLGEGVQRARQLWTAQNFDEALKLLGELHQEFASDTEVSKLLDAVRADKDQDEIQKGLAEARKMLGTQSFNEALGVLDKLLERFSNEAAVQKLRELVLQERSQHARQLRLQKELEGLKRLVTEEKFEEAIAQGEGLLSEYTDDFELARLVDFARSQKSQDEVLRRKKARHQEINAQVQAANFEKAISTCQEALKEFPGDHEFTQRLEQVRVQQKEHKDRERQQVLDNRLRSIRQSVERGELTDAIDLANRTIAQVGPDTGLTRLVEMAKQERSLRDEKRGHDEKVQEAMELLQAGNFAEAISILRAIELSHIPDERVPFLLRAAEEKRVPTKEEIAFALDRLAPDRGEGPSAGLGEETRPWRPDLGREKEKVPAGDLGGSTRVIRPEAVDDKTVTYKIPPVAKPPVPAHAEMNAAAIAPEELIEKPKTAVPSEDDVTTIAPPKPKEDKRSRKEKEREKEREREREKEKAREQEKARKAGVPTPAAPEDTTVVRPELKPPSPPVTQPPVPAAAASAALPAVKPETKAPPAPATAAPPVVEPRPKPKVEERKEPPPIKRPAVEEVVPPPPAKGGGMGMIIGGAVAALVIGIGAYMFLKPSAKGPDTTGTTTTTPTPTPPQPEPRKEPSGPVGPSPQVVKQFETSLGDANKLISNKKYDDARKAAAKLKNFVGEQGLPNEYEQRVAKLSQNIDQAEKNSANAAFQANLKLSNDLYGTASAAIEQGNYSAARQAIDKLDNVGEGNAHKDDVPNLNAKVKAYEAEDGKFAQAKTQAQSNDKGTLQNAKPALDSVANGGGRHAAEARQLSEKVGRQITQLNEGQVAGIKGAINSLVAGHDYDGARSKARELQALGQDPSSVLAGIESAERAYKASTTAVVTPPPPAQRTAKCSVPSFTREKYSGMPFGLNANMAQKYLDADPTFDAGDNCGLPSSLLQGMSKGSEADLLVEVDQTGAVTGGRVLTDTSGGGANVLAAAKSAWHFKPPTVGGKAVKTSFKVVARFN
jgi:serine/threonine protein kinase